LHSLARVECELAELANVPRRLAGQFRHVCCRLGTEARHRRTGLRFGRNLGALALTVRRGMRTIVPRGLAFVRDERAGHGVKSVPECIQVGGRRMVGRQWFLLRLASHPCDHARAEEWRDGPARSQRTKVLVQYADGRMTPIQNAEVNDSNISAVRRVNFGPLFTLAGKVTGAPQGQGLVGRLAANNVTMIGGPSPACG